MGATEEQMAYLSAAGVTHVSYVLILYSIAFLLYLFVNILLHIYATHTWPDDESNGQRALAQQLRTQNGGRGGHSRNVSFAVPDNMGIGMGMRGVGSRGSSAMASPFLDVPDDEEVAGEEGRGRMMNGNMNGHVKPMPRMPKQHKTTDSQQVRDAEEFELEGLISDVDDDGDDVVSPAEEKNKKVGTGRKEVV